MEADLPEKLAGREKERYINRLFGSVAPKYDLLNGIMSLGRHKTWRNLAVHMSELVPRGIALDVATGTGDFALELLRAVGEDGRVVGIDFCEPMLTLAARKLSGRPGMNLVAANAEHLPFGPDTFDCVTIGFGLRNVASVQATIAEMVRVTKPGRRVISLEILGPQSRTLTPLWRIYFHWLVPWLAQALGAKREPYDYLPDSVKKFYSREELTEIFKNNGLVDIQVRSLALGAVCIHMGTKE
jgi:demethylmenaquinone methyltransferase/2-methoxy-6-polyprenyl-1,4-benzoquinol methylase